MKILVMKNSDSFREFKMGNYPAHLLYGLDEMDKRGQNLIFQKKNILKTLIFCLFNKVDIVYFPYVSKSALFFYFLKKIFSQKFKLYGWQHKRVSIKKTGILKKVLQDFYKSFDALFFLSEKNLKEAANEINLTESPENFIFIPWYGDVSYFENKLVEFDPSSYFISTGKENRELKPLINGASDAKCNLNIYVNELESNLFEGKGDNIEINIGYFDYNFLLSKTSNSYAVAISLKEEAITYCVGLSSLVEALCLGRPIVSTYNPYWHIDVEREGVGIYLRNNSAEEWKLALDYLKNNPDIVKEMGEKAISLAKTKYNHKITVDELCRYMNI